MKFQANFWTNYVKFELLFIETWSTKEFYPAWITGETMHVLWPAWKRDFHFNDTSPPPSLLPRFVRLDVSINEGEGRGEVQLYGERKLEQKGPIKEWAKSKDRLIVDERWGKWRNNACAKFIRKRFTFFVIHFRQLRSTNTNDQRITNEIKFRIRRRIIRSIFKQREFIFSSNDPFHPSIEATLMICCSKSGKHFWRKGDTLISKRNLSNVSNSPIQSYRRFV